MPTYQYEELTLSYNQLTVAYDGGVPHVTTSSTSSTSTTSTSTSTSSTSSSSTSTSSTTTPPISISGGVQADIDEIQGFAPDIIIMEEI
jgi:hypothetical protein